MGHGDGLPLRGRILHVLKKKKEICLGHNPQILKGEKRRNCGFLLTPQPSSSPLCTHPIVILIEMSGLIIGLGTVCWELTGFERGCGWWCWWSVRMLVQNM